MIKLFEDYGQNFDYYFNKCDPSLANFLRNIKEFLETIIISDEKVVIDILKYSTYLELVGDKFNKIETDYILSILFLEIINGTMSNNSLTFYGIEDDNIINPNFPLLLKYIYMEISNVFPDKIERINDYEILFKFDSLSGINFSKEDYEAFKDSERFGL